MPTISKLIVAALGTLAVYNLFLGLPRLNNSEKFFRQHGEIEVLVEGYPTTIEVSLLAGQTAQLSTFAPNGSNLHCLSWEGEGGPSSVQVTAQMAPRTSSLWQHVQPTPLCVRDTRIDATIRSSQDQVVRLGFVSKDHRSSTSGGFTRNFCRYCDPHIMPRLATLRTRADVRAEGWSSLGTAALAFGTLVVLARLETVLSVLYSLAKIVLPSRRARKLREELRRTADLDPDIFDAEATAGYAKPSSNKFRRRQDMDDLDELRATVRQNTERFNREAEAERKRFEEEQRLTDDLAAAIERVEELKRGSQKHGS